MTHFLILSLLILASVKGSAHGEDKFGPNGGYLKMPGNFHTEVVPGKSGSIKIYLLDIAFKNPTVKNSKVSASITNKTKKELLCTAKRDYFVCSLGKTDLAKGVLSVFAERDQIKGAEAVYTLPLTLAKAEGDKKMEDHGNHN